MGTVEMLNHTKKATSLLQLVLTFMDSVENDYAYMFEDIRYAIEAAHEELAEMQSALYFSQIS